jgi:hypothetical protein
MDAYHNYTRGETHCLMENYLITSSIMQSLSLRVIIPLSFFGSI